MLCLGEQPIAAGLGRAEKRFGEGLYSPADLEKLARKD
jgi:hypothetical protein